MKILLLPFLLLLLQIPSSLSGGISSQAIYINPVNLAIGSCPTYFSSEQCKPLLTFEVQFDSGLDFGDLLTLIGTIASEQSFKLIHMAPLNEPFDRANPNTNYFVFNSDFALGQKNTAFWTRVGTPLEDLDGITYPIRKQVPPRAFFRLVFELQNGGSAANANKKFCLGLLTLNKNRQLIDSNECLYFIRFNDLVATSLITPETVEKVEMASGETWSTTFDSTNSNLITLTLLSSTINWQLGYAVEFKFPGVYTVPLTVPDANPANPPVRKITVSVTADSTTTPTWTALPDDKYNYEFTAEGYHRFILPHYSAAKGLLSIADATPYDVNDLKAAVRFGFLLQNKKPSYVSFEKVYFKTVIPNLNKIVNYGALAWAAAQVSNYAAGTAAATTTFNVHWGLSAGAAVSVAGNAQSLCETYALFSISNTAMFWNSIKFIFNVAGLNSFSERDFLTLLISETTASKLGTKFALKGSVQHNLPLISGSVLTLPRTDDILKITKIGDLPANNYFVALKLYVLPVAVTPATADMTITIKLSEGTSSTPIDINLYAYTVKFSVPQAELNKNLASFGGCRAFTYQDNPTLSELKIARSAADSLSLVASTDLLAKIFKKSLSIPKVLLTPATECHSVIIYFAIDYSAAALDKILKLIFMYNPKILQVESPESGVILVGTIFSVVAADAVAAGAFRGVDYGGNAASPALQLNAIYFSSDKKIATAQVICKPSSNTDVGCTKIEEYVDKKRISGIAFYKARIVGYPTQYADANVFDFFYCIWTTGSSAADPTITDTFTHVSTMGFNEVVLTGIATNSGASAVAAPYLTSTYSDLVKYYYLRMDALLNSPIYSSAKASFFSHDFTGVNFGSSKLIDFQESKLVDFSTSDGVVRGAAGTDLYKFGATSDLSVYEVWYTQGAISFPKTGMTNRVNVYLPLLADSSDSAGLVFGSINTLNVVIHDSKNVFAVYRIFGSARIGGKVAWTKLADAAKVDLLAAGGYCGASSLAETKSVEMLDYINLPTKINPDVVIRTGLGPGCNIKSGNKANIKGAAFVAMTELDIIDSTAPITWDHDAQNKDNKCFYHTLHTGTTQYRYYVLCQTDSYPEADFGNPSKYLRMKLKPIDSQILSSDRINLITYVWSNDEGKRVYQLPDAGIALNEWKPTCQTEIEVGWYKTLAAATSYKIIPNSFKLLIKNKRRYTLKSVMGPTTDRHLKVQTGFTAPYNKIKGCEHEFLECYAFSATDVTLVNTSPQNYVIDVEKLVITLILEGTSTQAFSAADVTPAGNPLTINQFINGGWVPQEVSTLKIKNVDITSSTPAIRSVAARDLKINPTFNSFGSVNVTFESKYPILDTDTIVLKFENLDPTTYSSNLRFFKIACSFYKPDGRIESRVESKDNDGNTIILGVLASVSSITFTISCEKIPFKFLSKTNDVVYSARVLDISSAEKYPSISPSPKLTVNPEILFSKQVILKKSLVGLGQESDYSFNFALNPGVTLNSAGRILILFTHQAPARLNNDGVPRCSVNRVTAICTFLEDYYLSVQIPVNLLTTPIAPSGSLTQPAPVMNEVLISGVKQGNFYLGPAANNHLEFRKEERIYFALDSDSTLSNGVLHHDYIKDPFINSANINPPKLFNIQGVEVANVDAQGRVLITVRFLKKLVLGQSLVVKLPKNIQDANLTVAGLNIQINRPVGVSDKLFVRGASFIRKGLLKIDLNPDDDNAGSYAEATLTTYPAYVLTLSVDLNFYMPSRKVTLTKDRFDFFVVDTISNVILETALPEINYVDKKPPVQSIPTSPTDAVKFLFSRLQTPADTFVQIIHKATNKCLKRSSTSTLTLINCDVGTAANPNDEFQATLFKLNAASSTPTGTPLTIDSTTSVRTEIESKTSSVTLYKLGMDSTIVTNTAFGATSYKYFQLEYSRNVGSFGNVPVFTICAYADVTNSGVNAAYRAAHSTASNCLNILTTTASASTITYTTKATAASSIPAQQFSFRVVSLKPSAPMNVEQKIDFVSDFINVVWKITASQAANLYFSVQSANADVAVLGNCNSRYLDKSPFPFVFDRDDFGFPVVRFRAPILKLKQCGFTEVSTTSPNLVGKIGYYTDPNYPASGKFSLVTLKLDSVTSERVSRIDNPDSYNWYFRNSLSAVSLNIGSELTFYDSPKYERLIYSIPFNSAYASLRLKAFEKYAISRLSVYLINLDITGTNAEVDSFLVSSTATVTTAFPSNIYNFTINFKGIQSGNYKVVLKYVVRPTTTAKRVLVEENAIPLRKSDFDQKEIEKHSFATIRVENSEENSSLIKNPFIAFLSLIIVLVMMIN